MLNGFAPPPRSAYRSRRRGFNLTRSPSEAIAHKTRKGFNLIEAAVVLAVIGAVVGGIWIAVGAVRENIKVNDTYAGIVQIASGLRTLYPSGNFSEEAVSSKNITTAVVGANIFPATLMRGTNPRNPWNGIMYVLGYNVANMGMSFHINAGDMPKSACIKLVNRMIGTAQPYGLIAATFAPAGVLIQVSSLTPTNIASSYCKATNAQLGFVFF